MRNTNTAIVNAAVNATLNSTPIPCSQIYAGTFMGMFSDATAAGTLKVQFSNDPPNGAQLNIFTPTNWLDVPSATATVVAGATVSPPMPLSFSYQWLRLVWTRTAGAGTITVNCNMQGF